MAEIVIKLVNGELAGQTFQTIAKNVNQAATELKKAQVGTQEWMNAFEKLNNAKQLQADYNEQLQATTNASNSLKNALGGALDKIPGFSAAKEIMGSMSSGVGGLSSQFGILKGAIAATGIGLLIIAITTLVGYFSKTEAGANMLGGAMKAIGNVVDLLFGKAVAFGKAIIEAFSNPKKLLSDLVDFMKDQVMNRINSFGVAIGGLNKLLHGDFSGGFKDMGDAMGMATLGVKDITDKVAAFGKEVGEAAKEGYNMVQLMDDIEDRQAEMEVTAKKNENAVNQYLLQAKNIGKSYEDRVDLLNKADALTRKSYADQLALSKEYLSAVNAEIDSEKKRQGVEDDTDEMRDKRKSAELAYFNLKGQEIELEEKIANRREQILGKQAASQQDILNAEQNIEKLKIANMEDGLEKQIALIKENAKEQIAALKGTEEQITQQKVLIEQQRDKQIAELRKKNEEEVLKELAALDVNSIKSAEQREIAQAQQTKQISLEKLKSLTLTDQQYAQAKEAIETKLNNDLLSIDNKYRSIEKQQQMQALISQNQQELGVSIQGLTKQLLTRQITLRQYDEKSRQAVLKSERDKLAIIEQSLGKESIEYTNHFKKVMTMEEQMAKEQALKIAKTLQTVASGLSDMFGNLASMMNQNSEEQKEMLIAQATMQAIMGAINAYTQALELGPIVGPIVGAIEAAVALAAGMANVKKIEAQPVGQMSTSYAVGGYTGDGGKYQPAGIVHKGEYVVPSHIVSNPAYSGTLSMLEGARLRGYAGGGMVAPSNPYQSQMRAPIPSVESAQNNNNTGSLIDYDKLGAVIEDKMHKKVTTIQVVNNVQDTQKKMDQIKQIQNRANI